MKRSTLPAPIAPSSANCGLTVLAGNDGLHVATERFDLMLVRLPRGRRDRFKQNQY
jgi:hypothetical protein